MRMHDDDDDDDDDNDWEGGVSSKMSRLCWHVGESAWYLHGG